MKLLSQKKVNKNTKFTFSHRIKGERVEIEISTEKGEHDAKVKAWMNSHLVYQRLEKKGVSLEKAIGKGLGITLKKLHEAPTQMVKEICA